MKTEQMQALIIEAMEDLKATDIITIDIRPLTSIADSMIICSGNSTRHVKSIARAVVKKLKENKIRPLGIEGEEQSEWVLVDAGDVIIHVMLPNSRGFYDLESLWMARDLADENS